MGKEHIIKEGQKHVDDKIEELTHMVNWVQLKALKDRQYGSVEISDSTKTKKWFVSRKVDRKRRDITEIILYAKTYEGSWNAMLGVFYTTNFYTNGILNIGVHFETLREGKECGGIHVYYDQKSGGKRTYGFETGYNGEREQIVKDLQKMGAVSITENDLPKKVDVVNTAHALVNKFIRGRFEPSKLILQNEASVR